MANLAPMTRIVNNHCPVIETYQPTLCLYSPSQTVVALSDTTNISMLPAVGVDAKGVVINLTGTATREHAYPFLQTT
jgi:hypothetical protein